jgi:hypothetical protein
MDPLGYAEQALGTNAFSSLLAYNSYDFAGKLISEQCSIKYTLFNVLWDVTPFSLAQNGFRQDCCFHFQDTAGS